MARSSGRTESTRVSKLEPLYLFLYLLLARGARAKVRKPESILDRNADEIADSVKLMDAHA